MSLSIFRSFHIRRPKDSVEPVQSSPPEIPEASLHKPLFPFFPSIHARNHSNDNSHYPLVDSDSVSYQSIENSSVLTRDDRGLTTYQSHTFQQSLSVRDHPECTQWKKLTSFMLQSQWKSQDQSSKREMQSVCWNFDRDYEESKDDSRSCNHHDEDKEEFVYFDETPPQPQRMGMRSALFADESKQDDVLGDSALMFDHLQLLTRHPIFRSTLEDLGSKSTLVHQTVETKNLENDSVVSGDSLDFNPRLQEAFDEKEVKELTSSFDNFSSPSKEIRSFPLDAPIRCTEDTPKVDKCFENILLVSPECFEGNSFHTNTQIPKMSLKKALVVDDAPSLADMVHPINLDLFPKIVENQVTSRKSLNDQRIVDSGPSSPSPVFMNQSANISSSSQPVDLHELGPMARIRKNLASSFRSKASGNNKQLRYCLSKGKKGMSEDERIRAKTMLPKLDISELKAKKLPSPMNDDKSPSLHLRVGNKLDSGPLSILLLHPTAKVFEIVQVDYIPDTTTVGDALSKARSNATDSLLSEQKYVSLCNKEQELAAPMLPVSLMVPRNCGQLSTSGTDASAQLLQRGNREARLLVAVPEGYTATWCQAVRRMLWAHPKIQRWWNQTDDPFQPSHVHVSKSASDTFEQDTMNDAGSKKRTKKAHRRIYEV